MKDGGYKKAAETAKSTQNHTEMVHSVQASECRKIKRKKTDADVRIIEAAVDNKRWSVADSAVKPEIMEDMGVGKLIEEDSSDKNVQNKPRVQVSIKKEKLSVATAKVLNNCHVQPGSTYAGTVVLSNDYADTNLSNDFFLYQRMKPPTPAGIDMLERLSDEMVLMIFRWLPKRMLIRSALVCKRWQRIAYDDALWTRLDLGSRVLKTGSLGHILGRGVVILRMTQADVTSPIFDEDCPFLEQNQFNKLQYLDLSMAVITAVDLSVLLKSCRSLHKLSLEHCTLNNESCSAIAQNKKLEVLNLSACYVVLQEGICEILLGCRRLSELNLAWTCFSQSTLDKVCANLPRSILRLNISGCRKSLADRHVFQLVRLCPNLVELDLSDCTSLTSETIDAICHLNKLEHVALNRCYNIPSNAYNLLSSIDTLMYLDVIGLFVDQALFNLEQTLPNISVNKFLFSSIARPTVGIRRTSIWGLRVRECQ